MSRTICRCNNVPCRTHLPISVSGKTDFRAINNRVHKTRPRHAMESRRYDFAQPLKRIQMLQYINKEFCLTKHADSDRAFCRLTTRRGSSTPGSGICGICSPSGEARSQRNLRAKCNESIAANCEKYPSKRIRYAHESSKADSECRCRASHRYRILYARAPIS